MEIQNDYDWAQRQNDKCDAAWDVELTEEEFDELHSATQPCSSDNQNTLPF